jgi:hypothetical protein
MLPELSAVSTPGIQAEKLHLPASSASGLTVVDSPLVTDVFNGDIM